MSFRKADRSYSTPNGWRLATFEETKNGLEKIKERGLLNKWDRVRLLDGWILGPGYDLQMGNDFRGCLGYMLLIQAQSGERLTSGTAYLGVDISEFGKEVALFLCADDWNFEVVYWLLNSWDKTRTMDLRDVRDGSIPIPFSDASEFKEMNREMCSLARKLGDVGPVSEKAAKRKYSREYDTVDDVLSDLLKIVNEANIPESYPISNLKKFYFPLEPKWLKDVSSEGDVAWNAIADAVWNFLSECFAEMSVEMLATTCLEQIWRLANDTWDLKTITASQENFIVVFSILYYLSLYRREIIHAPLGHDCEEDSCVAKIICHVASDSGPAKLQRFNQTLQNNAMWRCYEPMGNYDLLNKLLIFSCATWNATSNNCLVVNKLLECGAQTGTTIQILGFGIKATALHYAARWDGEDLGKEVAKKMLDKCDRQQQQQELANAQDQYGCTPLHWAASCGGPDMCEMLLDYGARLDVRDDEDRTALHLAFKSTMQNGVINVLMKHPHITEIVDLQDNEGNSPIDIAIAKSDIQSAAKLLSKSKEAEAYFNKVDREQLLIQSLLNGCVNNVEKLLEKGTKLPDGDGDGNEERKAAFHLVAMCEEEDKAMKMVDLILEKNPDKDKLVCKSDKRGRTALHDAAFTGHASLCRKLLDINPNVIDIKDRDGRNPLYEAVQGKQNEERVLKMLVKRYLMKDRRLGNLVDRTGVTPLHVAASQGKRDLLPVLLSRVENSSECVKRGDFLGQTALHKAAKRGDSDTVKFLLDNGADPLKERDCDGRTAVHYAVQAENRGDKQELVNLLLEGCKSKEEKMLLLWASAAGLGTADENISSEDELHNFFENKKEEITKKLGRGSGNLLKMAASIRDMEMTKELITRGYQIADIHNQEWRKTLIPDKERNVQMVSKQLVRIAEQGNDQPTISDNLGRLDYAHGLAALLLNPYLKPPIVVGISGSWGMGKSSLMVQTESILLKTAAQMALLPSSKLSTSSVKLPEITTFVLSKNGKNKYEEIKTQLCNQQKQNRNLFFTIINSIRSWVKRTDTGKSQAELGHAEQDSLSDFLHNYDPKKRKIFKSLAAMDSTDMFAAGPTEPREDQQHQNPHSKTIWDTVTMIWDKVKFTKIKQSTTIFRQSKADSTEEEDTTEKASVQIPKLSEGDIAEEGSVPAILTVQYNAWKYKNETEAMAGMAVQITKEMEELMTRAQWLSTCWRNTWKKKKYNIWIDIIYPCLLTIVLACTFTWIVWEMLERYKFNNWAKAKFACLPAAIVIIAWILTKSMMGILKPVSTQLMNYISFPDHADKLGYQERVISDINFLRGEIGKKPHLVFTAFSWVFTIISALWLLITEWWVLPLFFHRKSSGKEMPIPKVAPASGTNLRIIVFIDDLDRCQESVILQVLSAINLVLAVCEINVVLGIDKGLIERAIIKKFGDVKKNKSFKDSQELSETYLQKIIQLPLDLPDTSEEQSRKFLEGQLGIFREPSLDPDSELEKNTPMTANRRTVIPDTDARRSTQRNWTVDDRQRETVSEINPETQVAINVEATPTETRREGDHTTSLPNQTGREGLLSNMVHCIKHSVQKVIPCVRQTDDGNRTRRETPQEANVVTIKDDGNRKSDTNSWFSFPIREMLFVRYSQGERDAFCYFQNLATESRKLPREWKRLLNYHRLVWYIFSVSKEVKVVAGWQVQLITWIFICWEWHEELDFIVQNWNWNHIGDLKGAESNGPSMHMIVDHFIEYESNKSMKIIATSHEEKEMRKTSPEFDVLEESANDHKVREDTGPPMFHAKKKKKMVIESEPDVNITLGIDSHESSKRAGPNKLDNAIKQQFDELKKQFEELKDQVMKQQSRKNEKREEEKRLKLKNWKRLRSALYRYDVSMEAIQAFQRFRFYCIAGYLSWPLKKQENEGP